MRVHLAIYRFDPDLKGEAKYQEVDIDVEPRETVLSVLQQVYGTIDPSLSFRFACGVVKCGECSIMVNKSPCLACERKIEPVMTIEPLSNLPVIKDLVIDRNQVFNMILERVPFLAAESKKEGIEASRKNKLKNIDTYVELTDCYECLICQSVCPVYKKKPDEFVGPLGLLWLAQSSMGSGDTDDWDKTVGPMLEMCKGCGVCRKSCPSKRDILELAANELNKKMEGKTT